MEQTTEEIESIIKNSEEAEALEVSLTKRLDGKRGLLFLIKKAYEAECLQEWESSGYSTPWQEYIDSYPFEEYLKVEGLLNDE